MCYIYIDTQLTGTALPSRERVDFRSPFSGLGALASSQLSLEIKSTLRHIILGDGKKEYLNSLANNARSRMIKYNYIYIYIYVYVYIYNIYICKYICIYIYIYIYMIYVFTGHKSHFMATSR